MCPGPMVPASASARPARQATPAIALSLGIPKTLTELGVKDPDIKRIVAGALIDPSTGGNPVVMTEENTTKLLLSCI